MIESITIQGTRSSPAVECDAGKRVIRLSGESYPENTFEFYRPVVAWMEAVLDLPAPEDGAPVLSLAIDLAYLNTGSIKCMMDMLDRLDEIHDDGGLVSVTWRVDAENERIVELVEELLEDVSLPHEIITD